MPRISKNEYALTGLNENAAHQMFTDLLDEGLSIPDALVRVMLHFDKLTSEFLYWLVK